MAFAEILLPLNISVQSTGGPAWETTIARLDSGREKRNQRWSQDLGEWDIGGYLRDMTAIETLMDFWHARRGQLDGFLFFDPFDHVMLTEPLGTGTGALTTFQLVKVYSTYTKTIYKPKPNDMQIFKAGVLQVETTDYTLNDTTGLVTFVVAPADGLAITASGNFYKPVRFDVRHLAISYADLHQGQVKVPIVELRL